MLLKISTYFFAQEVDHGYNQTGSKYQKTVICRLKSDVDR